jgi:hypothetical protein
VALAGTAPRFHQSCRYDWVVRSSRLVADTRNAARAITAGWEKVVRA